MNPLDKYVENRIDEGAQLDHPVEWWYVNAILSSPGTPADGWGFINIYDIFPRGRRENFQAILVRPAGEPLDLSAHGITPGSIKTSEAGVNVSWGKSWYRGNYPQWEMYFERELDGLIYRLHLELKADVAPLFLNIPIDPSFLRHFVVLRHRAEGTITIGQDIFSVTAVGYLEHVYGVFNPLSSRGWYWYCVPATERDNLAINMGIMLDQDINPSFRAFYFTPDGSRYYGFDNFTFEVLEEDTFQEVAYPKKFRLTEKNSNGELAAIITRSPYAKKRLNVASRMANLLFVTGYAGLEGSLIWGGKQYDLCGKSIGSAAVFAQPKLQP